ncbi:MAG: HpsJ family protein [Synechococcaceae cyanobacterium]|nr:HpsJ family protein [Synechococcaceae cyanobacterium]
MPSRQLTGRFLGRLGEALILIFIVNTLFGLFPLQLTNPGWQSNVAYLVRTSSVYPLVGSALIFLGESKSRPPSPSIFPLKRIQRLAPVVAAGFLLLIPLQTNSILTQIRNSDSLAQRAVRQLDRQVNTFRSISSLEQLQRITMSLPPDLRPAPGESLAEGRRRLVAQGESELTQMRISAEKAKREVTNKGILDSIRDGLNCLIYALAFAGLRKVKT